jgi:hypothetical protein
MAFPGQRPATFELARRVLPEVIEFVAASSAEAQMD